MVFYWFFQKSLQNHRNFNDFRPKTMKTIGFPMMFNEFCLRRPSGVRPENLFFVRSAVRCAVRRPCAENLFLVSFLLSVARSGARAPRFVFVQCYFFLSGAGVLKKYPPASSGFMPRFVFLSGAICFCPVRLRDFFLSGAGLRGDRRQPGEASDNFCKVSFV